MLPREADGTPTHRAGFGLTLHRGVWHTHGAMKLPGGDRAELGTKIEDYVLNPAHREGRHKARVFESALGITLARQDLLRQAILSAAATSDQAEPRGDNGHGEVFVLRFPLETERGRAMVLTAWIIRHGEDFPRLTTCYTLYPG
jgi:Domain of unknown function (DUF6883)